MRNLRPYNESSFVFYQEVIKYKKASKTNPDYFIRLKALEASIQNAYIEYDNQFSFNNLPVLTNMTLKDADKVNLLFLYKYSSKIVQELKVKITTDEYNRRNNTCQNCTIGEIGSFDHIVPKEEFAEFAVHPKNLFPSCSKCNSYKSIAWRESGQRIFLNLYLDILPAEQYLFVNLTVTDKTIAAEFYLNNLTGINSNLFHLIKNHYDKLHLYTRFSENMDDVIMRLSNAILSNRDKLSVVDAKEIAVKVAERDRLIFGANYWKSILELALLNNDNFIALF